MTPATRARLLWRPFLPHSQARVMQDALIIGSRLDADAGTVACRLAFSGRLVTLLDPGDPKALAALRVFKPKQRRVLLLTQRPPEIPSWTNLNYDAATSYGDLARISCSDLVCALTQRWCMLHYRCGTVERVARGGGGRQAVCRGMFKRETDLSVFTGMQVTLVAYWHRLTRGRCSAGL